VQQLSPIVLASVLVLETGKTPNLGFFQPCFYTRTQRKYQAWGCRFEMIDDIGPLHAMSLGHGTVLFVRCCPPEVILRNVPRPFGIGL